MPRGEAFCEGALEPLLLIRPVELARDALGTFTGAGGCILVLLPFSIVELLPFSDGAAKPSPYRTMEAMGCC